ncbi:unnamed protein product, partial [Polarella glacialis]
REPGVCGLTCIFSSGCLPMIALHLGVFYGSSTFVIVLRRLGLMPTPTEKSPEFKCSFYTGWHLPGAIMSFPIALQGILAMAELAGTDSDAQASALASPFVQEGCTWFYVYLLVDTVLITLHGIGSKEIYVHHLIFLLIGVALVEGEKMGGQCCMALNGRKEGLMAAGLLTQEASTPLLNLFMLLRAFKGLEHTLTQIAFMLFAVLFFVFRIARTSQSSLGKQNDSPWGWAAISSAYSIQPDATLSEENKEVLSAEEHEEESFRLLLWLGLTCRFMATQKLRGQLRKVEDFVAEVASQDRSSHQLSQQLCQQLRQRTLEEEACLAVLGEAQAERRQRQSLECQQAESLQATLRAVAAEVRQLRHTAEEEEAESQERERGLEELRRPRPRRSAMGLSRSAAGGPPVGPGPEGPEVKAWLGRRSTEFAECAELSAEVAELSAPGGTKASRPNIPELRAWQAQAERLQRLERSLQRLNSSLCVSDSDSEAEEGAAPSTSTPAEVGRSGLRSPDDGHCRRSRSSFRSQEQEVLQLELPAPEGGFFLSSVETIRSQDSQETSGAPDTQDLLRSTASRLREAIRQGEVKAAGRALELACQARALQREEAREEAAEFPRAAAEQFSEVEGYYTYRS